MGNTDEEKRPVRAARDDAVKALVSKIGTGTDTPSRRTRREIAVRNRCRDRGAGAVFLRRTVARDMTTSEAKHPLEAPNGHVILKIWFLNQVQTGAGCMTPMLHEGACLSSRVPSTASSGGPRQPRVAFLAQRQDKGTLMR
jgi:hypothetical protein